MLLLQRRCCAEPRVAAVTDLPQSRRAHALAWSSKNDPDSTAEFRLGAAKVANYISFCDKSAWQRTLQTQCWRSLGGMDV